MKKIVYMMLAMLMATTAVSAQCTKTDSCKAVKPFKKDKTEMVTTHTQKMVEQYGLNAEQAAKLKTLNEKYAGKMHHGGPRGMKKGERPGKDSANFKRPMPPKEMKKGERPEPPKEVQEYETELKKIMTDAQYKAYQADKEKRMQRHQPRQD